MQLVRGLHNIRAEHRGTVLTIGNFDGVHRGHQAILKRLTICAENHNLPATVMIFEPHPEEVFKAELAPARLSRLREKLEILAKHQVARVIVVKFDLEFARMSAEQFVSELLLERLGVRHLIIGDDFRFGNQRQGDFELLQSMADLHGFGLERTETLHEHGQRISSTAVRKALMHSDLKSAASLLGHDYELTGKVVHGQKRGRTIGFPTANVYLHRISSPLLGVYAVEACLSEECGRVIRGIANIGKRPTVGGERVQLEVHLLDFSEDIYGQHIRVKFVKFIRAEQKFASFEQLKQQITTDVLSVKQYFNLLES